MGWASGIERLILLMKAQGLTLPDAAPDLVLCPADPDSARALQRLAEQLRDDLPNARVQLSLGGKLKAQLSRAAKAGARFAVVMGEAERQDGKVHVKSFVHPEAADQTVAIDGLAVALAARLNLEG